MPFGCCQLHVSRKLTLALAIAALILLTMSRTEAQTTPSTAPAPFQTSVEGEETFDRDLEIARLDRSIGEYADAMRMLEDLLDRIRDEYGPWDMRNVVVLTELAGVQRQLGILDQALARFNEALHVNRVNRGLHDATQVDILEEMVKIREALGDYERADQIKEYALYVLERTHGSGSPAILPSLYRLANWSRRTEKLFFARALYARAVGVVETNFGADDIRLVEALQGVARTYRQERYSIRPLLMPDDNKFRFLSGSSNMGRGPLEFRDPRTWSNRYGAGEAALKRAMQIVDTHAGSTLQERARIRLDLADWYLVFDNWRSALETYAAARAHLAEAGSGEARMKDFFGQPTPLILILPEPPRRPSTPAMARKGYVQLIYEVGARGRVHSVNVTASDPEGLMNSRMREAIKRARFRPRFIAGEPVATKGVEYRHEFVYYSRPEKLEARGG